jgi:hypothetical protein
VPRDVRTHTRRTASGRTTTVHHHTRKGDVKRKRGPSPQHAGKLLKRARAHGRKGRKAKAAAFGLLCAGEVAAWFTLGTTSFILTLVAGVLVAISLVLVR